MKSKSRVALIEVSRVLRRVVFLFFAFYAIAAAHSPTRHARFVHMRASEAQEAVEQIIAGPPTSPEKAKPILDDLAFEFAAVMAELHQITAITELSYREIEIARENRKFELQLVAGRLLVAARACAANGALQGALGPTKSMRLSARIRTPLLLITSLTGLLNAVATTAHLGVAAQTASLAAFLATLTVLGVDVVVLNPIDKTLAALQRDGRVRGTMSDKENGLMTYFVENYLRYLSDRGFKLANVLEADAFGHYDFYKGITACEVLAAPESVRSRVALPEAAAPVSVPEAEEIPISVDSEKQQARRAR